MTFAYFWRFHGNSLPAFGSHKRSEAWSALGEFRELLLGDVYQVHGSWCINGIKIILLIQKRLPKSCRNDGWRIRFWLEFRDTDLDGSTLRFLDLLEIQTLLFLDVCSQQTEPNCLIEIHANCRMSSSSFFKGAMYDEHAYTYSQSQPNVYCIIYPYSI